MSHMIKLPFLYDVVLSNMTLPNAMYTEFALINFLHSMHSNKVNKTNIFEEEFGYKDQSLSGLLFDNNLGKQPNSLGDNNMLSRCYQDYLEIEESSVFHGRQKYKKYIYPIRMPPYIHSFIGTGPTTSRINGEYFWKHMSKTSYDDVRSGKAIIFLDYGQENYMEHDDYVLFHHSLKKAGIPAENIIFAINSFNAKEIYETWFLPHEQKISVHNWPFVLTNASFHYNNFPNQHVSYSDWQNTKQQKRKFHNIYKVRRARDHRVALLLKLASDNLLEKTDWSCLTPLDIADNNIDYFNNKFKWNLDIEKVKRTAMQTPKTLSEESDIHYTEVRTTTDRHPKAYLNSYFYICTETFLHGDHKSLTEKAFKPIVNFQPFVLVAYPGALKLLHDLGFKTFEGFIDESYDNEKDEVTRINMIYSEINRISNMSIDQLHEWYWSMEEILLYNQKHFLDYYKNDTIGKNFIKYLSQRISQ